MVDGFGFFCSGSVVVPSEEGLNKLGNMPEDSTGGGPILSKK